MANIYNRFSWFLARFSAITSDAYDLKIYFIEMYVRYYCHIDILYVVRSGRHRQYGQPIYICYIFQNKCWPSNGF